MLLHLSVLHILLVLEIPSNVLMHMVYFKHYIILSGFDEGIGFGADRLNLKGCIRQESKMCKFLKAQLKKNANFVYYGQMLKGVMRMHARMQWKVTFGKALEFHCSESHMRVKKDGQRLVFGGNFKIIHTSEVFEGKWISYFARQCFQTRRVSAAKFSKFLLHFEINLTLKGCVDVGKCVRVYTLLPQKRQEYDSK